MCIICSNNFHIRDIIWIWSFADFSTYSNDFNYSGWRFQRVLIDYTSLMNKLLLYINSRYSCLTVRWTSEHLSKSQLFSRYLLVKCTVISMFLLSIYHMAWDNNARISKSEYVTPPHFTPNLIQTTNFYRNVTLSKKVVLGTLYRNCTVYTRHKINTSRRSLFDSTN